MVREQSKERLTEDAVDTSRYTITQIGRLEWLRAATTFIARSLAKRLLQGRIRRSRDEVMRAYDESAWRRLLEDGPWSKAASLYELLVPPTPGLLTALVEHQVVRIASRDYYDYRLRKLAKVISGAVPQGTDWRLIEVGCGWGVNLFSLALTGATWPMEGYDVSPNAVEAGMRVGGRFGVHIPFETKDLLTDDIDASAQVVMTYYCLEQLKYDTRAVVENIISWRPLRVIHIEPVVELYGRRRMRDFASRLVIRSNDYQDRLLTTVRLLEREGSLRVLSARRLGYCSYPFHEASCIVWEPVS